MIWHDGNSWVGFCIHRGSLTGSNPVTIFASSAEITHNHLKGLILQTSLSISHFKCSAIIIITYTMPSRSRNASFFLLVGALISTRLCSAVGPHILWTKTLPNGGMIGEGLRKGTGIILAENEESLWVTSETGSLNILNATDGTIIASFQPDPVENHYTESRSSVSLYQTSQSVEFGVYAVIDVPEHHGQESNTTSTTSIDITRCVRACSGSSVCRESHL